MITICMIRLCGISICNPLKIAYVRASFRLNIKRQMLFIHLKSVAVQKNYCLVSLLPVCSKSFERLLYNNMFSFFFRKQLNITKTVWIKTRWFLYQPVTINCAQNSFSKPFPKGLIEFGTKACFSKHNKMEWDIGRADYFDKRFFEL